MPTPRIRIPRGVVPPILRGRTGGYRSTSYRRRSTEYDDDRWISLNAPRMITVVLAIVLTVAGLSLTILPIDFVNDLLLKTGIDFTRELGYWMLLGSPALLIVGSLFPGI